jgi:hypothetical protein
MAGLREQRRARDAVGDVATGAASGLAIVFPPIDDGDGAGCFNRLPGHSMLGLWGKSRAWADWRGLSSCNILAANASIVAEFFIGQGPRWRPLPNCIDWVL